MSPAKSNDGQFVVEETETLIPWHRFSDVTAYQNSVWFKINDASRERWTYRFNLSTPEMANRVAYAMEFLRLHCDPTAGTGF